MIGNQTGKSTMNFRKPMNVPAPAVTDYQVGGATINSRHDDASASPVRGNGPANNHEYFELQQQTLRDISADARHSAVRAHLVSSSGVLNANQNAHQISPLLNNDYGFNIPSNIGLISPVPQSSHKKNAFFNGGLGTMSSHGSVLIKNQGLNGGNINNVYNNNFPENRTNNINITHQSP